MRRSIVVGLLSVVHGWACGSQPTAAPAAPPSPVASSGAERARGREDSSLIPRRALFGNPDRTSVQISPDGKTLAFLAPSADVLNVWVAPAADPTAARPVTRDRARGIRMYFWAFDNRHILYLQDDKGDENWRVHSVDVNTGSDQDLTPLPSVRAQITAVSRKHPGKVIVGLNDRKPEFHDLYRLDIHTGARELLLRNDEFAGFVVDDDFRVRLAIRQTAEGGNDVLEAVADTAKSTGKAPMQPRFRPFMSIAQEDALTTSPIGYTAGAKTLYLIDSRNRDTSALFSLASTSAKPSLIAADARADVANVMLDPVSLQVQAVSFDYERKQWQVVDPEVQPDLDYLKTVSEGDLRVLSRSLDDNTWIVVYEIDQGPARFYRYDRAGKRASFLFTNNTRLEGLALASMRPVVIRSRDGLNLISYLTLPPASDRDGDGRPETPVPLVLQVHGGPWGRDTWGYAPSHQWLANRGYASLSVNFRGSTGFGKRFINAGDRQWGAKMHDDLLDAVEWAIAERIAPRDKIAIMGGSYGGYATLVGMAFTPRVFACGVDIVGPSNLETLLNAVPPYWKPIFNLFTSRVGDPRTEEGRKLLESRSPLHRAARIERPLLIGQGVNDPRVKRAESDQIVEAMKSKGIPVTYVVYSDEGHGFIRPENRLSFFAVAEAFLSSCLGGSYQPVGNDFQRSTIDIAVGAELVPGLPRPAPQITAAR
jgi:dipeptidyl aminopeptidase/acylaminoacyl peptidase